jgi:hypothetical protein
MDGRACSGVGTPMRSMIVSDWEMVNGKEKPLCLFTIDHRRLTDSLPASTADFEAVARLQYGVRDFARFNLLQIVLGRNQTAIRALP